MSSPRLKIVEIPSVREPIRRSPGFAKKELSSYALDLLGLCAYGCRYCSSNAGNYLRINRSRFADLTEEQLGTRALPADDPRLMFAWPDVLAKLEKQLANKPPTWGRGHTLVFSMLTDAFSPPLVADGTTGRALEMVLGQTSFRVRILTKNACVGSQKWIRFFAKWKHRIVVGLSTGTTDDAWAKRVEVGTSPPSARLSALRRLQDAGIPTYGMLCPIFPDMIETGRLSTLLDAIQPDRCEHVWAEPYNDRANWRSVRDGYEPGSVGHRLLTRAFELRLSAEWSSYATGLYRLLREKARVGGWLGKLRYLLYEGAISPDDAGTFAGFEGVLLQGKKDDSGRSMNEALAALQG